SKQNYPEIEVIVIDNSRAPVLGSRILSEYPFVRLYLSPISLSYCESLNVGIGSAKGEFILCLNDDVVLTKEFIGQAIRGFDISKRIGMVSGKILRFDGKLIDSTGLYLSIWRTAKERGYDSLDIGRFDKPGYIFGVTGAVAFYRRKMLEDIKTLGEYFDTDFGFFYEDLDIAWRANNAGWKGYYIPQAIAYHARGGTARRERGGVNRKYARLYLNDGLYFDLIKNRYLTIVKNESLPGLLIYFPFIIAYSVFSWFFTFLFRPVLSVRLLLRPIQLRAAFKKRRVR
ncbi:MAG: glycosyltransferase, partial [Candidatus Omnitrophica bacterium]|nr:glycosyltransferase [Candidatus Omnitrophota bacterium]